MFKQFSRYSQSPNSHDLIKFVASIAMVIDHMGLYVFPHQLWMRAVGRLAAPLFFFLIGYSKNHRFRSDLLYYGLFLTAIGSLLLHALYINVLINFIVIKWIFDRYDEARLSTRQLWFIFFGLVVVTVACQQWFEYGGFGVLFALSGNLVRKKNSQLFLFLGATTLFYFIIEDWVFQFDHYPVDKAFFATLMILLVISMNRYMFKQWKMEKIAGYSMMFISRYSLQIYVIHLATFMLYALMSHFRF